MIATGVRRQDQIREGLATQAARSGWFWCYTWEEMLRRGVSSKVGMLWSFHVPHMMSSPMYSGNCAGHLATFWHFSWSRNSNILLTHGHACVTFFFGDRLSDTVLEASTCCTLFNLFQQQNLGIRCIWTRSLRAPWNFRWASRREFLPSTAPVHDCQDTSALQEVLKKALEKVTWSWRESPNIPPKVVVKITFSDCIPFARVGYVNSQDFTRLLRYLPFWKCILYCMSVVSWSYKHCRHTLWQTFAFIACAVPRDGNDFWLQEVPS